MVDFNVFDDADRKYAVELAAEIFFATMRDCGYLTALVDTKLDGTSFVLAAKDGEMIQIEVTPGGATGRIVKDVR